MKKAPLLVVGIVIVLAIAWFVLKPGKPEAPIVEVTTPSEVTQPTEPVADAKTYTVKADSTVQWKGEKVGGAHNGVVNVSKGSVQVVDNAIVAGEFVLDMTSIKATDIDDEKLDNHLKADDFFDANAHPTATFVIKSVDGNTVKGDMTIKNITKEITFDATEITVTEENVQAKASFSIDRTLWDVKGGMPAISEYVELDLDLMFE